MDFWERLIQKKIKADDAGEGRRSACTGDRPSLISATLANPLKQPAEHVSGPRYDSGAEAWLATFLD